MPTVPTFTVDLTGNPDSTWISPPSVRNDQCCGVTAPDQCVQFIVTLDPGANSITMDIPEGGGCGAKPPGALFYQVNCGPQIPIGTPVCVVGVGPHIITFCKPGNNANCYAITSIPAPDASGDAVSTDGCAAILGTVGYDPLTIVWSSIPSNPVFEGYLSCTIGCDTVIATHVPGAPASVTYQVCGFPLGSCAIASVCDTMTVYFVSDLSVQIQPDSPAVCFGAPATTITANVTGGAAPYTYTWTSGGLPVGGNNPNLSVLPGTYIVQVGDTTDCPLASDTVTVTSFALPIDANAGTDTSICAGSAATLAGQIQAALGGLWSGGTGTFIPGPATLNAQYLPSPAEIAAGFVDLQLITTGNFSCPADSDVVRINIIPVPVPVISGISPVCEFTSSGYSTPSVPGNTYNWVVSGGSIASGQGTNAINVNWGATGAGTVTVTETNPTGCDSTVSIAVVVNPVPNPVIAGPVIICEFEPAVYSIAPIAGSTYSWVVSGGLITVGQGSPNIAVDWGATGAGSVTVTHTNSFGCDTTVSVNVTINPKPVPPIFGSVSPCAWTTETYATTLTAGSTYLWAVSGGTIASGQGTSSINVDWGAAGAGSVTLTETNSFGCDSTRVLNVVISPRPVAAIVGPATVCELTGGIAYSSAANVGATYTWSVAGGTIASGQGTTGINVNWGLAGAGTVTLLVELPSGCDTTVALNVIINPKPTPVIAGPASVCEFTSEAYSTPLVAGHSYNWSVSGGAISAGQGTNGITVAWGAAGAGSVTVTQTSAAGCDSTVTLNVIINPTPQPVIAGPLAVCEFTPESYSTPLIAGNTYNWVVAGGVISAGQGTNAISVNWGATGAGTVSVTETSPAGCDTTITVNVVISPTPLPVIAGPITICEFEPAVYSIAPIAGSTYSWVVAGGLITGGQGTPNIAVDWGATGAGSVTVTQTNAFGCDTTVSVNVTINPKPVPPIFGSVSPCAWTTETYATTLTAGSTYLWAVSGGTIASGQGTTSINVDWGAAGAGSVTLTETNSFGCDSTRVLNVVISPRPVAAIVGPATVCELTGGIAYSSAANVGATYTWSVAGGTIASGQGTTGINVDWGLAGAGTVTLLVELPSGCDTTVTLNVIINPKPTPVIAGPASVCEFTSEAYSTPLVAGHTYNWSVSGGAISAGQGTNGITVAWGAAGAGSVTVTQTSAAGCDSTVTLNVIINPTPQPVIAGPLAVCEFTPESYSTPLVAGNTYNWVVAGGVISAGQGTNAISVNWGATGAGTVSVTETSPAGCDTTITVNVVISPTPLPVIAGPISVCQYDVDVYSVTAVAGDTYNWSATGGFVTGGQGTNSATISWSAAGPGTVTLTQTTPAGCDTTITINVLINPNPLPVIVGPVNVCQFDPGTYSVTAIPGDTYNWSVSGGAITAGQGTNSINVSWGAAGAGSVSVTQTTAAGCDTTITLPVTITLAPVAAIVGPATVCELTAGIAYSSAPNAGATYLWTVAGGAIASGQGTDNITVNWGLAGAGNITLLVTLPSGCDTTVSLPILINPKPTPVISGPVSVCAFTSEAYSTPAVAGHSYNWSVSGGAISAGQGTNGITVAWGAAGAGTVTVTQTSAAGCDSTVTINVLINPTPQPVIAGPLAVCEFTPESYSTPLVAGNTYNWVVAGGVISAGQGTNAINVNWGAAGAGTVSVTETSPAGCDTTITVNILISPTPQPVIAGPTSVCQYDVDVYSVAAVPGDIYVWSASGGTVTAGQGTNSATISWGAAGAGSVTLTQTSPAGCDTTITLNVTINPKPLPVIAGPPTVCQFESATYSVTAVPGDTYNWSVSGGAISGGQGTNSINVIWGAAGAGSVTITQTNPFGCDTTITLPVTITVIPVATIVGPATVCELTAGIGYSTPPTAGAAYNWTVVGGAISSGQGTDAIGVDWGLAGAGNITLVVTLPSGCDTTVSLNILINPKPTPVIAGPTSVCAFTSEAYSTPAVAGHTYNWSVSGGAISAGQGTNAITVAWGAAGAGTVTVTQTSAAGCDSTVTINVLINPTPQPVIAGNTSVCEYTTEAYSTPLIAGDTYNWVVSGGAITSGQGTNAINVYWGATGAGTVSVTETSAAGCDTTVTINIIIDPKPNPVIAGPTSVCQYDVDVYSVTAAPGDTYNWVVTGGFVNGGQGTASATVQWGAAGIGTVSVTQTTPAGCDTTVTINVTINPKPLPVIVGLPTVCQFDAGPYSVTAIAGDTYNWSVSGGAITSGQGTNSINVAWGAAGAGSVTVTQTTPAGCDTTITLPVTILLGPVASIIGPDSVCERTPGIGYSSAANPGATYTWTVVGGQVGSGQGTNNVTIDWSAAGLGSISLLVSMPGGCDTTVTLNVTLLPKPTPVISGSINTCAYTTESYNTPAVAGNSYVWSVSGGNITFGQGTNSINVFWGAAGAGSVMVTQTTALGCDSTVTLPVTVNPTPQPVIAGPTTLCEFTGGNIYSTPAVLGHTYLWAVSGGNITVGQGTNSITIYWGATGAGTVTLTQTASPGAASCDTTVSINITINPKPNPVISGPTTVCQYDIDTYSVTAVPGDLYNWVVTGGSVSGGQGTASATVQWGAAGIGTVSVTQTNPSGCDTTVTINVTINPKPLPVIVGNTVPCAWTSETYSVTAVAGNTYSWSVSGGNLISGQGTNSINVDWLAANPGASVTITQTNAAGCDTTITLNITVNPRPIAAIVGPDTVCELTPGVVYSTAANAGAIYAWSIVGGSITAGQGTNSITVGWSSAGAGSLSLLVTLPTGCDTTVSMNVTLLPKPTPVITGVDNVCAFTSQSYSTPNVAGHSYSWVVVGGSIASGQGTNGISVNWASAGAGSVTVTQTTALGCDSTVTLPITVNPTPQPVIGGPVAVCEFTGTHVYSTPAAAGHTYGWVVAGGNITAGQGTNSITVYWGAQGSGTVTLTQTAPFAQAACDTTVSINVTINPKPNPVITGPSPVCALSTMHMYSVPAVGGDTYSWAVVGGQIAAGQGTNAIQVTWGASGVGTVSVTQENPFGCDTTVSISITILPQPVPAIVGPSPVCAYQQNIIYSTPFVAGNSYLWSVNGGSIASGQGTNTISVDWSGTPGTGFVVVTETHPLGCDSTVVLQVNLLPAPTPVITGDDELCGYTSGAYQSNIDVDATINWSITGDGQIASGQGTNGIVVAWGAPGAGAVSVTYSYTNGCDSTVTFPVNILNAPIPILIGPDTACQRSWLTYTTPSVPGVSYTWIPFGGTVVSGQGFATATIEWFAFGDNTLTLYAVSTAGCDTTLTMNVHILYAPVPQIRPAELTICKPGMVTWDGTFSIDEIGYDWNLGNGGSSTSGIVTSGYWIPGDYDIELITPGPYGCPDTAYALLHVLPGPDAQFTVLPGLEFVQDYDTATFVNTSTQFTTYFWDFGDGSTDTTLSPEHFFAQPGEYTVTLYVTDSLGCVDSTSQTLTVTWDLNLFVPTGFTPNGDGLNDFFNVVTKNVTDFHLMIFSRWGELIYETRDVNFQWPGDYHGEPMQEGAYVWKINATLLGGTTTTKAGTVTLLR